MARDSHSQPGPLTPSRSVKRRLSDFLRRLSALFVRAIRFPASLVRSLFSPAKVSLDRRALLQGRFVRFRRHDDGSHFNGRYPIAQATFTSEKSAPRSLHGISIEPVPATEFSAHPPPVSVPVFRPPGAISEPDFLRDCTHCGDCITACPHHAIQKAPTRLGAIAGTPILDADRQACWMCEDFPCIAACGTKALTHTIPITMGTAKITPQLCLAHQGTTCTVCSERCPVPGAIALAERKPFVVEDTCTGCGVCRYVCPAPENAVLLMPMLKRPTRDLPGGIS